MWELQGHLKFSAGEERRGRKEWTMPLLKVARLNLVFSKVRKPLFFFFKTTCPLSALSSVCTELRRSIVSAD